MPQKVHIGIISYNHNKKSEDVTAMYRILVCDDEIKIRETIKDYMSAKGIFTVTCADGEEAVAKCEEEGFDLIILDVMMPNKDGITACKEIRELTDTPVLFLSALGQEKDFLSGYKSGGDDYIVKPFPLSVLYEKCLSIIKRYNKTDSESKITLSGITLDLEKMEAYCDGRPLRLALKDFHILHYLMINKGIVLDREKILVKVWGYNFDGDIRTVDTHIKRIRKILGDKKDLIKTVIGSGYTFKEEE